MTASVSEVDGGAFDKMEPPKFAKPINATEVKPGAPAHFVVEVAGSPMPEITWYREGHQILHSEDFQIIQVRGDRIRKLVIHVLVRCNKRV